MKKNIIILLIILIVPLLSGCQQNREPISKTGLYFDTVITITTYDSTNENLLEECFSLCSQYENMLSKTIENSDVWKINNSNGQPTYVSSETIKLLNEALYYSKLTQGKIDPTIDPLSSLWDFTSSKHVIPSDILIKEALSHVNYENIIIKGNYVTLLDAEASIDLGFIAKGYIADKLKELLLENNVASALINLGGNILVIGSKPQGDPFHIGIQKPFDAQNASIASIAVINTSVVSSGVYERYFELDGKVYHHLIDSKTGYPRENNILGVTIISQSSLQADALSTSCFMLGVDEGMELIESLDDVEAIFITDDFKLHYSTGAITE